MPQSSRKTSEIIWYTTGQVARHCQVTPETVANWIRLDQLRSGSTPGGHHRVSQAELLRFCREHGFSILPEWETAHHTPTVLIIDDDPEIIEAVVPHLEREGRKVIGTSDTAQAGLLLIKHQPDVVILDLHLPGTDGVRIASMLRHEADLIGTKIIVLSGFIDNLVREAMKDLRVACYVDKPPDFAELAQTVDRLLSRNDA